ncbi:hypothetical protein VPNG_08641 [Cytospora leucostoma]|uniref:Uncharacterized protein n=1 Tax=Cytospora leucostoma TaxID=1230097 RepID=A0A423W394_9PEZI|nr:hypothetical protein VPNG_08641 [Cytospora leucostoma]
MTIVFITGANRGLGKGFVQKYLSRPNTTVIGSVRNVASSDAQIPQSLPKAEGSKLILVKIENTSDTDAKDAVASLKSHGIESLDIVIANAAWANPTAYVPVAEMKTSDLIDHVNSNSGGVIRLFQATLPLLKKGTNPRFLALSTGLASFGMQEHIPFPSSSYASSKAVVNFLVKRIHLENEDLIAFVVNPGGVATDGGNAAAAALGLPPLTGKVEDSVDFIVETLDNATRADTSGKFLSFGDTPILPW